jgi:hypothetical protein
MERIQRGFRLLGASWEVLKADRELMLLPVFSFIAIGVVAGSLFALAWGVGLPGEGQGLSVAHYILIALFYFFSYAIGIYFNAAVIGAAMIRLEGGDPTVSDGLRLATQKLPKILGWAALAATVGLILRSLEERAGFLARIVIAIVGAAWSAITFFVVPVLLYEPLGVTDSVKRSAGIFKQRWGEQFTGNATIGLAMFVLMIPIIAIAALLWSVAPGLGIAVGVVGFGFAAAAGGAMSGIFNAALYRYATTGQALGGFTDDDLRGAFRQRRRGGGTSGFAGPAT